MDTLYIIVPCYNEEKVIEESIFTLHDKLLALIKDKKISEESSILFVDDGSRDKTWEIIKKFILSKKVQGGGICLAHNRGHQNALMAGLLFAANYADFTISIDADLQQDINAFDEFIDKYYLGNDIVYGIRNSRDTDKIFKRITGSMFYKLMRILGCEIVENSADYRLLSKKAIKILSEYEEVNLFIRGIIPLIGLKSDFVYYDVAPRKRGESKYTFGKMLTLALDGITSFTIRPIRLITLVGIFISFFSIAMMLYVFSAYFRGLPIEGWSSLAIAIWLLGGIELLSIGIIGEYIGKTYMETKRRPRYDIVDYIIEGIEI